MKLYLIDLVKRLSKLSRKLDNQTLFTNKKWVLIDELDNQQTFIFESDGNLIMSISGIVKVGTWKYIDEAKSILINRGDNDIILLNNTFFDSAVMILKYDGASNDNLFILVNQNIIPNLDVESYLKLRLKKEFIIETVNLIDDKKLEIFSISKNDKIGCYVLIDGVSPENCSVEDGYSKFVILNGRIEKITYPRKVILSNGSEILIDQANYYSPSVGDLVFIQDKLAPSGRYKLGFLDTIKIVDGVILYL
tara:strand:- start:1550 stop:2299 length:750 start_codon:yes stop_codon:yes gene_type:complete